MLQSRHCCITDVPLPFRQRFHNALTRLFHLCSASRPGVDDRLQHLWERRHFVPGCRWEIRAREEWSGVVIEEDGHRPSTVSGHRHRGIHVNSVDVRTLFTVDLDRNEVLVHPRCDGFVLERFMRHDVAPVTGRIPDGQEDRNTAAPRLVEGILSPLPPVHRVMRVLQQVRGGCIN